MEDSPNIFDPWHDYVPDFSQYSFDPDTGVILDPQQNPVDQPYAQQVSQIIQNSPNTEELPTLQTLLEAEFQNAKPEPQDPSDIMPEQVYTRNSDSTIFFPDCAFAGPILRSEQQVKNRDLQGFILIPACYVPRIRSRYSNHGKLTPCLYIPQIDAQFAQYFE